MDPRKVYTRPTGNSVTPLQNRAFDIIDGFIEKGNAAYLTWWLLSPDKYQWERESNGDYKLDRDGNRIPRRYSEDDRYDYWLLVKRGGNIDRLIGWETEGGELGWKRIPQRIWKQDWVLEFAARENRISGETGDPDEILPLTQEDLTIIGIETPEETN